MVLNQGQMSISLAVVEFVKNCSIEALKMNHQTISTRIMNIDLVDSLICTYSSVEQQVEQHTGISANCGPEMEIALTVDTCTLSCCSQCPL